MRQLGGFSKGSVCISCGSVPECFILEGFRGVLVLNMDDLSWLLVATKPRSEFVARQHLERQGFEVCLPQIRLRKRKQGVWQQVTEPMFPGYVFVGLEMDKKSTADPSARPHARALGAPRSDILRTQ